MRVLGIDCGTEHTGYGLIESDGRSHRMVAAGCIHTSPKDVLEARLLVIARGLREVIAQHAPDSAAVEEVFYAQNVKTADDGKDQSPGMALFEQKGGERSAED